MKWKQLFAVLLGLLMVGVTAGSAVATSSPVQNSHAKVVFMKDLQAKLLVDTPTRQVFTFGDLLIDYRTTGREAKIVIKNTTTSEILEVVHITSIKIGNSYLLGVKDASGATYSAVTPINMIAPGLRTKQLISQHVLSKESKTLNTYFKPRPYLWDGVYFVKGYMIKYPHLDYEHYGIEPRDSVKIFGHKLIHYHFSQSSSQVLAYAAPVVFTAAIGAKIGGAWDQRLLLLGLMNHRGMEIYEIPRRDKREVLEGGFANPLLFSMLVHVKSSVDSITEHLSFLDSNRRGGFYGNGRLILRWRGLEDHCNTSRGFHPGMGGSILCGQDSIMATSCGGRTCCRTYYRVSMGESSGRKRTD